MTKLDFYWASNEAWFHMENGRMVINEDAPDDAKKSYEHYLKQIKEKAKYI